MPSSLIAAWSESSACAMTTRVMARRWKKEHTAFCGNLNLVDPQKPNVLPSACLRQTRAQTRVCLNSACKVIKMLGFKCERHSISVSFEAHRRKQSLVGLSCTQQRHPQQGEAVIAQAMTLDSDLVVITSPTILPRSGKHFRNTLPTS